MLRVLRPTFYVPRLTILAILTTLAMSASGAIVTVDDDGPADFQSIQAAIGAASEGDVIQVAEGIYQETITLKNGITIQGAKTGETRIEFGAAFFVVLLENIQSGGIFDCTIVHTGQNLSGPGSGIGSIGGAPVISNNVVTGTQTGIFVRGGEPTISNNLVMSNGISGIVIYGGGAPNIINNTIIGSQFDGIYTEGGFTGNVTNNIIAYNARGGIVFWKAKSAPVLEYNDLWQNAQVDYYQIEKGSTDVSIDPLFMDPGSGNYRLAPNSPLLGAGKDGLNIGRSFYVSGIVYVVVEGSPANAGDAITVSMIGETGGTAHFSIEGIAPDLRNVPMDEVAPDYYRGEYFVQWGDVVEAARVLVTLMTKEGDVLTDSSQTVTLFAPRIQSVSVAGSPAFTGSVITVILVGQPESAVSFSIEGVVVDAPMPEISQGNYVGEYQVKVGDIAKNTPVIVRFTSKDGVQLFNDTYSVIVLPGAITVDDDGQADFNSIQAAIDAAQDGDIVLVAAGTYLEHVEISRNVHLLGAGRDLTRIEFSGEYPTVLVTDTTEASIEGFTLVYSGPETDDDFRSALWVRASNAVVSANRMTGTGFGIRCSNGSATDITNNLIDENRRSGIVLRESNAQISGNTVRNNKQNGILTSDGTRIPLLRDNQILGNGSDIEDGISMAATIIGTIENNTIKENGRGGIIGFQGCQINLIQNNQILANRRLGFGLMAATVETIKGNTIKDNKMEGIITFEGSQINLIQDNQILANGNDGIQFQGTIVKTIENNTIKDNKRYGIYPLAKSQVALIQDNQILANGFGLVMTASAVETVQRNLIKDNGGGIFVWGSENRITRLQDNQIIANSDRGVYLEAVTVETFQNNLVKDNKNTGVQTWGSCRIDHLQANQILANKRGIELSGKPTVGDILNNLVKDNVEDGILAFEGCQVTQIQGNELIANGTNGLGLVRTTVETIQNNLIKGNECGLRTWGGRISLIQDNEIADNKNGAQFQDKTIIDAIQSNLVQDNTTTGFAIMDNSQITLFQANLIVANHDGGIRLLTATVESLRNNTIVGSGRDGIYTSGLAHVNATNNIIAENGWRGVSSGAENIAGTLLPNLGYNDVWNNALGNYGSGIRPGVTDIHVNPLFVDTDNRDYHLRATSPLIGAGENGVDIGAIPAVIREMEILGSPARVGEKITFRIVAELNAVVSFGIVGIVYNIPMPEVEQLDPQAGMPVARYQGEYTVSANDRGINVPLILRVETESGYVQIDTSQVVVLSGGIQSVEVHGSPAKAGGVIEVTLLADAGGSAEFSIDRVVEAIPMTETADGVYQGSYQAQHGDNAENALLTVVWTDKEGRTSLDRSQTIRIDTITVRAAGSPARASDVLIVTAAGKSGNNLTFRIQGLADTQESRMMENPGQPGIYTGEYLVKPGDNVINGVVVVTATMASGDSFVNETAKVTIDTIPPEISGVKTDVPTVQNGGTFELTLNSEPGAFVTVDVSALDSTQSLLALSEAMTGDQAGRYSRKITVSLLNESLDGGKTLPITAIDAAGNQAESLLQIELSNPVEIPSPPEEPTAFIRIHPDVLPADGISTGLVTASLGESIASLSAISLHATVGQLSDWQLVKPDYLTATYTSGLLVGEATLTLTILESGRSVSTSFVLKPPDFGNLSQLSYDYLPQHVRIFQSIRVSGKLIPQVSGEVVLLTIASPDTLANEVVELRTGSSGRFAHLFAPDKAGIWSLQLKWSGDGFYQAARSELRQIVAVTSISPSPLTESGWDRLTTADKLTSNQITSLAEDRDGRIWIGTDQGISVFDGQVSETFTTADGLLGDRITTLTSDATGRIWIGSAPDEKSLSGGLTVYDGFFQQLAESETSLSYVLAIHEDPRGNLWIGGDGLVLYDGVNFQPIPLPSDSEVGGKEYVVSALAGDVRERIWVGTNAGLFLYESGRWSHFTKEGDGLPGNNIQALLADSQGALWIGAFPEPDEGVPVCGGLARYDGTGFEVFNVENSELASNSVTSLMEDSEGQILIGMLNGGAVRFGEWKPLSVELESRSVSSLLQDSQGQLWVGTDMGTRRFDRQTFSSWEITQGKGAFWQDREGVIWAGSETGLMQFDGLTWEPVLEFWNVPVYCIAQHGDRETWVGSENGLSIFDGESWTHLTEAEGMTPGAVTALHPAMRGAAQVAGMFLGTKDGSLIIFDGENWRSIAPGLPPRMQGSARDITAFAIDSSGVLWVGTEQGLFRYDGAEVSHVELAGELAAAGKISDLAIDTKGNLWIATHRGLFMFDGTAWQTYTIQNSEIASDYVTSLAVDSLGRIWIGTDSGISRYDGLAFSYLLPEDAWAMFTTQNSNLANDDIRSIFVDGRGHIWISMPAAITRFAPNLRPPETKITRAPRSTVGTDSPFFQYSSSDVESERGELLYSYKVDSGGWSAYSKNTFVTLLPQSNGVHTFFVRAMDKDSNVDPTPAQRSFRIDITPPTVTVTQPAVRQVIGGKFEIQGYAVDGTDFESYTLLVRDKTGQEVFRYESQEPVENDTLVLWDSTRAPDGIYTISLTSTDKLDGPDDGAHTSQTSVSVIVDNTLPVVSIASPVDNQSLSGIISIKGQASDANMRVFELMWTQATEIDEGISWQPIVSQEVHAQDIAIEQTWDSSTAYGLTTVRLMATDMAGNAGTSDVTIQLGNVSAKPTARFTSPATDAVIAGVRKIVGTADDPALKSYTVDFGAGEQPTDWTEIIKQVTAVTEATLATWDTTALPDGKYTLRLTAIDSSEYVSVATVNVTVDNTQPVAMILPSADSIGARWIAAGNVDIRGTATDANFDSYVVEYGEGADPGEWTPIGAVSQQQVADGALRRWSTAGLDGVYALRLTVTDRAGLSSVSMQPLTLDNQQSGARILYPEENQFVTGRVAITGTANDDNFKRYQISVGQGKTPTGWETLMESSTARQADVLFNWDTAGLEDEYSIRLIVEDFTTVPVEEMRHVTVDNTPPQAEITSPEDGQIVSGSLEIVGTAQDKHFSNYLVERAPGANPLDDAWEEVEGLAVQSVTNDVLRLWNTAAADDGIYSLRLTVTDDAGHIITAQRVIITDNQSPEAKLKVPAVKDIVTGIVDVVGTASDANLEKYQVFVAPGEQSGANDWQLIGSGTESKTDSLLAEWDTEGLDGKYSIKLIATDLSGLDPVEDIQVVIVDNTDPTALITSPRDSDQVGGVISLIGTAMDANFREYVVEFGEGPSPQIWTRATAMEYRAPVEAGELMQWLPGDRTGGFTLRLTVMDQVAHSSFASVTVDVLSPMAKDEGGERISSDGGAMLYLPPRALPGDTVISINPIPESAVVLSGSPSGGTEVLGRVYEFCPKDLRIAMGKPATLSIRYDVVPSPNKRLVIAHFDDGIWIPIGGTVDEKKQTVTTAVTELGSYALMEIDAEKLEDSAPITNLTCQPRIFSPNGGGFDIHTAISFKLGNSAGVTIKIYNRAGKLKRLLTEDQEMQPGVNTVLWDGRDDDGGVVKSDLYIVVVTAGDRGEIKTVAVSNNGG